MHRATSSSLSVSRNSRAAYCLYGGAISETAVLRTWNSSSSGPKEGVPSRGDSGKCSSHVVSPCSCLCRGSSYSLRTASAVKLRGRVVSLPISDTSLVLSSVRPPSSTVTG